MRHIFIGGFAVVATVAMDLRAEAASVVTDVGVTLNGDAVSTGLLDAVLTTLALGLGNEVTGSTALEPGSTGTIGDPDNREGFIGAEASLTIAGIAGVPILSAFEREFYDQVEDFPIGNIRSSGALLTPGGSSASSDVDFTIAGGFFEDQSSTSVSFDSFAEFVLRDGMPEGQAVLVIVLSQLDPEVFGAAFTDLQGDLRVTIDFAPIPLPAGMVLFLTGAAFLARFRR